MTRAYIIRANKRQGGVGLSLIGSWGNLPYPDVAAAQAAVVADAGRDAFTVERQGC